MRIFSETKFMQAKIVSFLFFSLFILSTTAWCQNKDQKKILEILDKQTQAWNRGDIDAFMVGYWNNDSLMFIGQSGVTYGYQNTLNNYKKNYGDAARMGQLKFNILHVNQIAKDACFVVGKWNLTRSAGNVGGHYTVLFRKIKGQWVIVADHSS
jgi:ketosteroid isomerase-like protein